MFRSISSSSGFFLNVKIILVKKINKKSISIICLSLSWHNLRIQVFFKKRKNVRKYWFPNAAIFSLPIMNEFILPLHYYKFIEIRFTSENRASGNPCCTRNFHLCTTITTTTRTPNSLLHPHTCVFHVYVCLFLFSPLLATCTNCTRNSTCFTVGITSDCICDSGFYQNVSTEMCISMVTINTTSYEVSIL